jgi:hypothetical protein
MILWSIHPIFFSIYAVLSLSVSNPDYPITAALRSLVGILLVVLLIMVILKRILRDSLKTSLLISGLILLVFAYGHVRNLVLEVIGGPLSLGWDILLVSGWLLLVGGWIYLIVRRISDPRLLAKFFTYFGGILILFPLISQVRISNTVKGVDAQIEPYRAHLLETNDLTASMDRIAPISDEDLPDVYYIILDAYARGDVLEDLYQFDNSEFIQMLEEHNFYIAQESRSNYDSSELSIASSLNMLHFLNMSDFFGGEGAIDEGLARKAPAYLIDHALVFEAFEELGYTTVAFNSGYPGTEHKGADIYVQSPDIQDASLQSIGFELMLLDTSIGKALLQIGDGAWMPHEKMFEAHRSRILFTLDQLSSFSDQEGPHFIYAHIVNPHVPFVFGPDGERIQGLDPFTLLDARPGDPRNVDLYRGQVQHINKLVTAAIEEILVNSAVPPIIIIQADHGSRVFSGAEPSPEDRERLQFEILNALHIPGVHEGALSPNMSPVNTFRIILNELSTANFPLLEDRSYVLDDGQFKDACEEFSSCP